MTQSSGQEFGRPSTAAAAASSAASAAVCSTDVLLNNFQLKKKSYRVLLHGQRLVWEPMQPKVKPKDTQQQTIKTPLPDADEAAAAHQQDAPCNYGLHSHILHMDDIISVRRGDTKEQSLQPPPPAQEQVPRERLSGGEDVKPTAQFLTINYAERLSKSKTDCNRWQLRRLTFYNADAYIVRQWEQQLQLRLNASPSSGGGQRVRRLLVFVNPYGGRKAGSQTYERQVRPLFQLAGIDVTCITTQRANQIRDILLSHDLSCYDAVCCVGGDGTVAEVINGLVFRRMRELGLDEQQPAYVPRPTLPVAVIPAGSTDTIVYSMHGTADVRTAAIHVLLGQKRGLDVCSVSSGGSLLRFCASVLSYGYLGDVAAESEQYRWMGTRRYEYSGVKAFLSNRGYDAELQLLEEPAEPPETPLSPQSPVSLFDGPPSVCYANCQRCSIASTLQEQRSILYSTEEQEEEQQNGELKTQPQQHIPESDATTLTNNTNPEQPQLSVSEKALLRPRPQRPDTLRLPSGGNSSYGYGSSLSLRSGEQWKIIRGNFFMICGANITCACSRSPNGISRYSHLGDGCLDLILVRKTSLLNNVRFLLNTAGRGGDIVSTNIVNINQYRILITLLILLQRTLPFVEVYRTRKFIFRTFTASQENSSLAGSRQPIAQGTGGEGLRSEYSSWNCDGEVVTDLDITMR